jgi:hypothetical protein
MSLRRLTLAPLSLVLLGMFTGCASRPTPSIDSVTTTPAPGAEVVLTQAAQTADHMMTEVLASISTPSSTPEPTLTPTFALPTFPGPELDSTPFYFLLTPSPTETPSQELDCEVLWQSVIDGKQIGPGMTFSVAWTITNTGTAAWDPGQVDFTYFSGTKMNQTPLVQLPTTVGPGETVTLDVDMRTPNKTSRYTTVWSLRRGEDYFCSVRLTISVSPAAAGG